MKQKLKCYFLLTLSSLNRQLPVNVILNVQPQYNGNFCWRCKLASPAAEFKCYWDYLRSSFLVRELYLWRKKEWDKIRSIEDKLGNIFCVSFYVMEHLDNCDLHCYSINVLMQKCLHLSYYKGRTITCLPRLDRIQSSWTNFEIWG